MSNNLTVKIVADTTDATAKMAVYRAELNATSATLRQVVASEIAMGTANVAAAQSVQQAASDVARARGQFEHLREQMKASTEATKGLGGAFEEVRSGLSRAFQVTGIAAAAEAVRMVGESVTELGERATQMRALSDVLGVNTSQLQAMQVAAEEAGIETETFARASEHLTNLLSEARNGQGKAIEQLHALGITTADIANPTFQLNELLAVLKIRLEDVNSAEQTRKALLQDLGARTALAIAAIKEYDGSQKGVADAMNRINGLSGDQIEQLEKTKSHWAELGTEIKNATSKALAYFESVSPSLKDMAATLTNGKIGGGGSNPAPAPSGPGRSPSSTGEQQGAEASARAQEAAHNEALKSEMETIREGVQAFGEGTAQRLAMLRQYAAAARQYYGSGNVEEVRRANAEVLAADRAFHDTQGREAISEAKTEAQAIAAESSKGALDKLEAEKAVWSKLLSGDKLNEQQRLEAAREFAAEYASANKEAAAETAAIQRIDVQTTTELSRMRLAVERENLNASVAATKQAVDAKAAAERQLAAEEFNIDLKALQDEMATLQQGTKAYELVYSDILKLKQQLALEMAKINNQMLADEKKTSKEDSAAWRGAVGEIENAESSMVSDLLNKRKSLSQSLREVAAQMVTSEIQNDLRSMTSKRLLANQQTSLDQQGMLLHLQTQMQQLQATTQSQAGQTAAVDAGNSARVSSTDAAALASHSAGAAAGGQTVMADAAKAFSGTYASVAQIPYVGAFLAPAAAAAAYAAVAAMEGLASLDVGTNFVPQDMPAMLHKGEAVVPAEYNPANGGGYGGDGGGTVIHNHHNYGNISMSDTNMKRMLESRSGQRMVADGLHSAYRRGARPR